MVPEKLEDCIAELCLQLSQNSIAIIKSMGEDEFIGEAHHDTGRRIRNEWGLWQEDSLLKIYFKNLGLWHPDDMSGVILRCFHRHLNGKPFDVEGQVSFYKEYWKKMEGCKPE